MKEQNGRKAEGKRGMGQERKRFREKSIRAQMREVVIAAIILFVFLCTLINESTRQLVYSNADEHTKITAVRLRDQIDFNYDKIKNYCISIGEDESVRSLLGSSYAQMSKSVNAAMESLTSYKILEPTLEDISLVNDRIHYSTVYSYDALDRMREEVRGASFVWMGVKKHLFAGAADRPDMLVYAGDVIRDGENLGTVILSLDSSFLQLEDESEMSSSYLLADSDGSLYPLNCTQTAAEEIYRIWKEDGADDIKKMPYYIHAYYFEEMDCYLLSALNVRSVNMGLSQLQLLIWGCVLLAVFFCVLFFLVIGRGMVRPLQQFSDTMHLIRTMRQRRLQGELKLYGCAEIAEIGQEFVGMMEDIETLNKQIFRSATDLYELKVQKQEAELAYLRSQIDPHFLYNTLEAVRKMALDRGAPEIARVAVDMGNIFRYSTKGNYEVALEEEISIIKSYIRIQQTRFQGKIQVYYFVAEEVLSLKVIKMLLQPIVENSIFHGLEPKSGEGSLFIGARQEEDRLVITVKDDGIGIPEQKLLELQEELENENVDTSRHVGILNTNARIRLQYGREYGLKVESCEEDGTTVTMTLPAQKLSGQEGEEE